MAEYQPDWCGHYREVATTGVHAQEARRRLEIGGLLGAPKEARVLDLCSGTCETLRILAEAGYEDAYGLDLAPSLLAEFGKPYRVVVADCRQMAFPDRTFDYVVILTSLHHIKPMAEVRRCLAEVYRVLRPSGTLCLIDHHDGLLMKAAIGFLRLPVSAWFARTRRLRGLVLNEKDDLGHWLRHWRQVFPMMEEIGYTVRTCKKASFHVYIQAVKPALL